MRFVVAIVSFVVALGLIGLGIAQRTVFAEPDRVTSEVTAERDAPITIIDGNALNVRDGRQKIEIDGAGTSSVFAAYGRTADLIAWAGDTSYNHVVYDEEAAELTARFERGTTDEAVAPAGSDLWLGEYTDETALDFTVNLPEDISLIVLSDGLEPAPATVAVTWAVDNRAPWSGPLLVGGVLILLLGLLLYLWALAHLRKTRGPRRKPPPQQKLPRKPRYNYRKATKAIRRAKPKAIERPRGRRSAGKMTAVLPVVLATGLVLSGCSAGDWPDFITGRTAEVAPTPTASALSSDAEILQAPAVTVPQLEDIVGRIAEVAATADADRDAELVKTRFTGAALQLREANYAIRLVDNEIAAPPAIPGRPVALTLPQQSDTWPRTVLTVIQEAPKPEPTATEGAPEDGVAPEAAEEAAPAEPKVIPTALMLVQETPRDQFKVAYSVVLETVTEWPDVAGAAVGAVRQSPENKMLTLTPAELPAAYADVMMLGSESQYFEMFDVESDALLPDVGAEAKAARAEALSTTTLEWASEAGVGEPIAMATSNSGALVMVSTAEVESAKPKEAGAILSPEAGTKALSGVTKTTAGVSATYAYQLLFYVPPAASGEKIALLGFSEGLVAAKEL